MDSLAEKRKRLEGLMWANTQARLEMAQRYPDADINVGALLERSDRRVLRADIARLSEAHIDELLEHYAPTTRRYVW